MYVLEHVNFVMKGGAVIKSDFLGIRAASEKPRPELPPTPQSAKWRRGLSRQSVCRRSLTDD